MKIWEEVEVAEDEVLLVTDVAGGAGLIHQLVVVLDGEVQVPHQLLLGLDQLPHRRAGGRAG